MHKSAMSLIFIAILLGGVILSVPLVAEPTESELIKVPIPVPVTPPELNKDFAKAKGGILFCGVVVVGIPINIEEN